MGFQSHILEQCLSYPAHKGFNLCSGQSDSPLPTAVTVRIQKITEFKFTKFCLYLMICARNGLHLPWQMDVNCILINFKKLEPVFRVKCKVMALVRAVRVKQTCYSGCWCPPSVGRNKGSCWWGVMTATASRSDSGFSNLINWLIIPFRVKRLNKIGVEYF